MIETEYAIELADYKAAQRLYLKHRPWSMVLYVLLQWVLPGVAVCFVAWSFWLWVTLQFHTLAIVGGVTAGLLWMSIVFLVSRWWSLRRGYRNICPKGIARRTRLTVDEQLVISGIPGESEGRFYWKAIHDYAENEELALLFVRKKLFLMVPRRALDEAQWAQLRTLVREGRQTRAEVAPEASVEA